jgi:3-methyladenine DNA glycosylase/8-oxoguanine DNA glycosylase
VFLTESTNLTEFDAFSFKDSVFKVHVKPPFGFMLYYNVMLRGKSMPLPYLFSETSWRCIIVTTSGNHIPTYVVPRAENHSSYLIVKPLYDYSTDEEKEIKDNIAQVFCSNLNLEPFYREAAKDDNFFMVVNKLIGLKPNLSQDPFEALIKAVIRQLVHADAARRSISMLIHRFGTMELVDGDDYYSFPSAEELAKATKKALLDCKVGYKWKLIKKISEDVVSNDLDMRELRNMSNEEIIEILTEIKGIGYWTSRIFLYDGLKRLDTYPIRDISLRKAVSTIYFHGDPISWEKVELFFKRYRRFVGIAACYLFGSLWLERIRSL